MNDAPRATGDDAQGDLAAMAQGVIVCEEFVGEFTENITLFNQAYNSLRDHWQGRAATVFYGTAAEFENAMVDTNTQLSGLHERLGGTTQNLNLVAEESQARMQALAGEVGDDGNVDTYQDFDAALNG